MAKPGKIVIDHEEGLSVLATWWKAIFLTPIWAFLWIMPLGALIRSSWPTYDLPGFFLILGLGLIYFANDMAKRSVVIDGNNIQCGLTRAPLCELQSINVSSSHLSVKSDFLPKSLILKLQSLNVSSSHLSVKSVFLPKSLILKFESGQKIELLLSRLQSSDIEQLIEIVSRRVGHCKIDPALEDWMRRRRPPSILRLENPDKFEAQYHSSRVLEELPQILKKTVHRWARLVGPIGTIILAAPVWLAYNMQLYHILRSYEDVGANRQFYESLVAFLTKVQGIANHGLVASQDLSLTIAASPVVAVIVIVAMFYLLFYIMRALLGANRLTIDSDEISLDRFFSLFSFIVQSAKWKDVGKVLLEQPKTSADPNQARINFFDKQDRSLMSIEMGCLSRRDREKLSLAIIKFAGESYVAASLTEALQPSQEKSYTELWLKSLSDTPARRNLEPLLPGHLLENSRYEIDKKLAVGGEGVAYLGRDLQSLAAGSIESVVLKETLIPPFVDKQVQKRALERFEREARLLKELESEYVVGLRDYFIEDHRCYLVLDYVEGKNLRQYVAERGPVDEAMVLKLAKQMAAMLGFLHDRGVIHRDFTPDNLILQEDGRLKLIDFNVARESDEGKTGTIVGKHAYVPPEQFRGKPSKQSDLYALGATLHFLLVGGDPVPISQSKPASENPQISQAMDQLVQDCTALDTIKRMQSVADVVAACQAMSANQTGIEAPGPEQGQDPGPGQDPLPMPEESSISIAVPINKKMKSKVKVAPKEAAN